MHFKRLASNLLYGLRIALATVAVFQFTIGAALANAAPPQGYTPPQPPYVNDGHTVTPIKHVIVIIGENRSFDHVFATYVPKHGQQVLNLLSEGIIKPDGSPGPNFNKYSQTAANDPGPADDFLLSPPKTPFPGSPTPILPAPLVGGPSVGGVPSVSYFATSNPLTGVAYTPAQLLNFATTSENGLNANYTPFLLTGGSLAKHKTPDARIAGVSEAPPYTTLPSGPFQITGPNFVYDDYAASPVHRFYQMWQQLDCGLDHASFLNPSGCDERLFSWVEVTDGAGSSTQLNGLPQPATFSTEYAPSPTVTTGEGSTALAFYNVQNGDVPYFTSLANEFAMSDNFHQSVEGGTGANHIMFGHGDAIFFYDPNSATPYVPPHLVNTGGTNPDGGSTVLDEVENPNPQANTNNWYTEDGYGEGSFGTPPYGGGSYSDCSDPTQPGVSTVVAYLRSIHIDPRCESGHYYLLNNYNPGYFGQGENAYTDTTEFNTIFTIPPSSTPSIGDDLIANHISWKYYGDDWNNYAGNAKLGIAEDKYQLNYGPNGSINELGNAIITNSDEYCNICNPFQYDTSIMANTQLREEHIKDTADLYYDIQNDRLPAVSIVKPSGLVDGHPSSSKLELFEGFVQKIVELVQASPYWGSTAIFITEDEGGGYYDSGYVQPLDFFGDGTRIIFLVVSPWAQGGYLSHDYADHVSILKFIERNWNIPPVTNRSRDNFPNPISLPFYPWVPLNSPSISDLFDFFDFGHFQGGGNGQ